MVAWDKGMFVLYGSSAAGEIIVHHKGGSNEMIKMVIPTQQSVSSAYSAAKAMGGFCSGVVFFRHQIGNEALALSPAEISRRISGRGSMSEATTVEADDGFCVAVSCIDLFVRLKDRAAEIDQAREKLLRRLRNYRRMQKKARCLQGRLGVTP